MKLRGIDGAGALSGKRVLLCASIDVPVEGGAVADDFRLLAALRTITLLKERGARVIVLGKLGRRGESNRPVFDWLQKRIPVSFAGDIAGERARAAVSRMGDGDVLLLENVRIDPREEANEEGFARELASLADLYVNDAFPVAHRSHASIVGVPKFLPAYAGPNLIREVEELEKALSPEHPAIAIIGGAKFETKMPVMSRLLEIYDHLCVGGALANDFLKVQGYEVGISLVSDRLPTASFAAHPKLLLPIDITVDKNGRSRMTRANDAHPDERIADIGPETLGEWEKRVREAKFVLWNGPLGIYEKGYREPTEKLARTLSRTGVRAVVGGGDTIAALSKASFDPKRVFVSAGGGAMLEFLANGTLPGLEPLRLS